MYKPLLFLLFLPVFVFLCSDCTPVGQAGNAQKPGDKKPVSEKNRAHRQAKKHCFRSEIPFADEPENKDISELFLEISGRKVSGEYRWLPAFKDRRIGHLAGKMTGNRIDAAYFFEQEGQTDSLQIRIWLEAGRAIVSEAPFPAGFADTLPRTNCGGTH